MMMAVVVETRDLLETVAASVIGGIGVTVIFSVAIWGAARFIELSRSERPAAAAAAAAVGIVSLVATLGAVAVGLIVMTGS